MLNELDAETRELCSVARGSIRHLARTRGYAVVSITDGDPAWCYTVGLSRRFSHPELIMVGWPGPDAEKALRCVGQRVVLGTQFHHNDIIDVGPGTKLKAITVDVDLDDTDWLRFAVDLVGGPLGAYGALQLVWHDPAGRFPWDPEHDQAWSLAQPLLGFPL